MLGVLACSDVTSTGNGVIAIQVQVPADAAVEPGDTLTLVGPGAGQERRCGQRAGLLAHTGSDLLTMVDSIGLLTTDSLTGAGEVQAYVGSLLSPLITITVHPPSDTLALVGPDTMTVPDADTASAPLDAAVQTLNPPGGVPAYLDQLCGLRQSRESRAGAFPGRRTVAPRRDRRRRKTAGPRDPAADQRVCAAGQRHRGSVAFRPSQATVPGSGQRFIVRFQ